MVLKIFIQYLINKYLKNYIERLDYEKLNYSLKNGNVLLENLRLKPEALAYLNIPATVAVGYIEQLKLTIPWKHLNSRPTEVYIDGIYLLIVSKNESGQDLREHYADKMIRVQQKVDNLQTAGLEKVKLNNTETAFLERMRLQIKQNLVFKIQNLHICYERKSFTKLGHPFSCGITLDYLELTTANNVKLNKQIKGNILLIYKIKKINLLSIYWNTKCKSRLNMSFKDIVNDLKSKIAKNNYIPNNDEMNYILRPINFISESVIILKPKENYYERSRIIVDIQIEQMNFYIDSKQISDILDFIKFQNYTTIRDRCQEYRELLLQAYFGVTDLTQEQKQRLHFLELKLDVFHLAYIRHEVEMEMYFYSPVMEDNNVYFEEEINETPVNDVMIQPTNNKKRAYHRWNSLIKMKNNLSKVLDHVKTTTTTPIVTQDEKEFFFEDLPKYDFEIKFKKLNLNLLSTTTNINTEINNEILTSISINDARINFKRMSISPRIESTIDLQFIQIFGMGYNKQYQPPLLLEMLPSICPHLHIEFELFPEDQTSDYRLYIILEPLKIIYDAPTINRIVECFASNNVGIVHLQKQIKRRTFMEMERDFPYKKIFDMKINLKSISFLLPEYGVYQKDFSMIRIIFDNLILKSCLDEDNENKYDNSLFQEKLEERQFYIKYKLELNDLRIIYSLSNKTRIHLLRRIPLIDIHFYKCVYSDDANLTKWRVDIKTVMREIYLSKIILTKLILHFDSIPLFYSDIINIIKRINFYFVIFSSETSFTVDLSISNCYFRFLMHPQRSIRTDLHIYLSKKRNENSIDKHALIMLNEPTIINYTSSPLKQSSQIFYRTEQIKLIYSNSILIP